jgi:hypothetical protein
VKRIAHGVTGILHGALGVEAARLAIAVLGAGGGGGGGGRGTSHWTAQLMAQPFGKWLVAGVGLALIAYAVAQINKGFTGEVEKEVDLSGMRLNAREWVERMGRVGNAARGFAIAVVGIFFIVAGLQSDPSEARGVGGALRALQDQPFGPYLLGAVALGFVAYGIFQMVKAAFPPPMARTA